MNAERRNDELKRDYLSFIVAAFSVHRFVYV